MAPYTARRGGTHGGGGELSESAQEMRRESASRYPEEGGGRQSHDEQRGRPRGPMRTPLEV